jgi:hypothetical protein
MPDFRNLTLTANVHRFLAITPIGLRPVLQIFDGNILMLVHPSSDDQKLQTRKIL